QFESHRISSYDRTGGNADRLAIQPGETRILAEIQGPGAITHIWNTIDAEPYYSRMLVLRFYWDDRKVPSVEVPLGDFFGVGHGMNRPFQSLPVCVSSDGRARNCYWYMPFRKSAKITVTHEGTSPCRAFYYYIDYQTMNSLPDDILYFHAQYRQATPNPKVDTKGINLDGKKNYLLIETEGKGLYVGTVLSVQMNTDGWFGEGDDMFYVDGAENPTMTGTGTEDYFNDAWGFREFCYPYHGVTVWEGSKCGDRGTAYKWHIFDPVAFNKSLRATIEHGHANDRQDDFYSVAFWYQTLPGPRPPALPEMTDRLPDEGHLYMKQIALNQRLARTQQRGDCDLAIRQLEQYERDNPFADEFGYCSLRRGLFFKRLGRLEEAGQALRTALKESSKQGPKAAERGALQIRPIAEREIKTIENPEATHLYLLADDRFELFVDGKRIAEDRALEHLRNYEIPLPPGPHVIAVRCENAQGPAGLSVQISHARGFILTDMSWKTAIEVQEGWQDIDYKDDSWANAVEVNPPGTPPWVTSREPFAFVVPLLFAKAIWSPEGVQDSQTVYFRKRIQID
ncbi:MAG TPA: DUF2961 domain-containing protein, partial [bacterium]|nr:DUF2961 domain-containing protein [bacterium]